MIKRQTTLLLVLIDDKILLAEKKRGFGAGKLNGIGGKVEPGETVEQAMLAESFEEIGAIPNQYQKRATITFDEFIDGQKAQIEMSVYVAYGLSREPQESEEMRPMWFKVDNIPYDRMFPDDKIWLPEILNGNTFNANFKLDNNFKMLSYSIEYCPQM